MMMMMMMMTPLLKYQKVPTLHTDRLTMLGLTLLFDWYWATSKKERNRLTNGIRGVDDRKEMAEIKINDAHADQQCLLVSG